MSIIVGAKKSAVRLIKQVRNLGLSLKLRLHGKGGAPRGKFVLVTGNGHCGTKWLSRVLHAPDQEMVCYHEHKATLTPLDWYAAFQHEFRHGIEDGYFDLYYRFFRHQLSRYAAVGDSNSWTMAHIPLLHRKIKVGLVIHLVRNGIQNVHSSYLHNLDRWQRDDWFYDSYLRSTWELMGRPGDDWNRLNRWECWCFFWSLNLSMPDWMRRNLGEERVVVVRLEDLTTRVADLQTLLERVNPAAEFEDSELASLQGRDVNRKIRGDRTPHVLWSKWTPEQQTSFRRLCGPTMEHYGYPMP